MAREFARLMTSIWTDPDFTALKFGSQTTYLALISSPDLSWCGVVPWLPRRLATLTADGSERKTRAAVEDLESRMFVILDRDTDELLVRTYVRHDGILKQPNVTKAMVKALEKVRSTRIRDQVITELGRASREQPDASGWACIRSQWPELYEEITGRV